MCIVFIPLNSETQICNLHKAKTYSEHNKVNLTDHELDPTHSSSSCSFTGLSWPTCANLKIQNNYR